MRDGLHCGRLDDEPAVSQPSPLNTELAHVQALSTSIRNAYTRPILVFACAMKSRGATSDSVTVTEFLVSSDRGRFPSVDSDSRFKRPASPQRYVVLSARHR